MLKLSVPFTAEEEIVELRTVLASGVLTQGPKVAEFERAVQAMIGCGYAFAMSSATTALHLSLAALGIGPGDEVLVSDFTYPASGNVICHLGARPVCVDVLPDTYAMDPNDLKRRVTPRSKAIMVVHPFGLPADMDPIGALAAAHGIALVEDAACALGATYKGRYCGTFGKAGCFSFHPRKSVTTGEGGLIATDDAALAERIALLRSHGGARGKWYQIFEEAGFNYRMSDLLAAVGVAQLRRLEWAIECKRARAEALSARLAAIPGVTLPVEPQGCRHSFQSFVAVLEAGIDRDRVIGRMRELGVETTLGTYAMHAQPYYQRAWGYRPGELPTSWRLFRQTLALPLYPQLEEKDLDLIAASLQRALTNN